MEYFVEIDRETIKRILVLSVSPLCFAVTISLLLDEGREIETSVTEVQGDKALRRLLRREGVPPEELPD